MRQAYVWAIILVGFMLMACLNLQATCAISQTTFCADLGIDVTVSGLIMSIGGIGYMLPGIVWGSLADRVGVRRELITAGVFAIVGFQGFAWLANDFVSCIIWWLVACIGLSGWGPSVAPKIASSWFHPSRRAKGYMLMVVGGSVMGFLAGIIQPQIIGSLGWRMNFSIMGIIVVATYVLALVFMRNYPADVGQQPWGTQASDEFALAGSEPARETKSAVEKVSSRSLLKECFRNPITWKLGALNAFYYLCFMANMQYMVTTLVMAGFTLVVAGLGQSFVNFGRAIGQLVMPTIADKICRKYVLIFQFGGIAIMGVVMSLFLGAEIFSTVLLCIIVAVYGFFDSALPVLGIVYSESFPVHLRATGPGIVTACGAVGAFFGRC